jgi:hypothetical protein
VESAWNLQVQLLDRMLRMRWLLGRKPNHWYLRGILRGRRHGPRVEPEVRGTGPAGAADSWSLR